jgi:predicted O-methyltransferase YrrM
LTPQPNEPKRFGTHLSGAHISAQSHVEKTIAELADWAAVGDCSAHLAEIRGDSDLLAHIERAVAAVPEFRTKRWDDARQLGTYRIVLYVLVRATRPSFAIETGVLHGLTSLVLLAALERNGAGRLVSIDLPSYAETGPANRDGHVDTLPSGREPGWIVGAPYAARWQLRLGRSLDVLPGVIEDNPLDFFLHDSEHTYETMFGEMSIAWERLSPGALLVCDNIADSGAFADFCRRVDRVPFLVSHDAGDPPRFGILHR